MSKANKAYAAAVITGLALVAVVATHRDASAQVKWCGYSGGQPNALTTPRRSAGRATGTACRSPEVVRCAW